MLNKFSRKSVVVANCKKKKTRAQAKKNSLDESELSFGETSASGQRGASGDQFSNDSDIFFADDESDDPGSTIRPSRRLPKACRRCKSTLGPRTNYCRACYNIRRTWMPERPTRGGSSQRYSVEKWPRRCGHLQRVLRTVGSPSLTPFSALRRVNTGVVETSSSESIFDQQAYLREERRKRLDYLRRVLCLSDRSTEGSSDTEALTCLQCGSAPIEAVLIHGKSGHLCVCRPCALHFRRLVLNCPQCGETVEDVIIPRLHR